VVLQKSHSSKKPHDGSSGLKWPEQSSKCFQIIVLVPMISKNYNIQFRSLKKWNNGVLMTNLILTFNFNKKNCKQKVVSSEKYVFLF